MNNIELNAILYYSDFLSLTEISLPVTNTCKYFYIHGVPINSAFIIDEEPYYDTANKYFLLALKEYCIIKEKYGEEGINTFIEDICSIRACGCVDAIRMLKCIHLYSTKHERKLAFNAYNTWLKDQIFFHTTINEKGEPQETECSKYVYNAERMLRKLGLVKGLQNN